MLLPLLALLPLSRLDGLLLLRFTLSSLAYVPGVPGSLRPGWLEDFVHPMYDSWLTPRLLDIVIAAVVVALVWWRRPDRPELLTTGEFDHAISAVAARHY
jgi:hypothetical protein